VEVLTPGNIISIIVFVTGLVTQWIVQDRRVTRLESRVENLEKTTSKLENDILKRLDKMDEKIDKLIDRQYK
jgi:hypothetical protein